MVKVLVHHSEIGLKGGNFTYFEKKLVRNIKKLSKRENLKLKDIERQDKRIICEFGSAEKKISEDLKCVFGIKNFSFIDEVEKKEDKILKNAEKLMKKLKTKTIAFKTKRSDKQFPLNSMELHKEFGEIANGLGIKVDYKGSEHTIFTEITSKKVFMYTEKIQAYGGMPVGTSGRVLVLHSGGIDSPVAAWLMMKRGCQVDFLHFHTSRNNKLAHNTKITKLVKTLNKFQGKSKLYLVPYSTYEIMTQGKLFQKHDLVFFKHYLLKFAQEFAIKNNYDAIVTGDNLGQVASQTMENIKATSLNINIPFFRPLITYDKQEIINLAREIDTYELSIEKYKDCCSILSKKPSTKTKVQTFQNILDKVDVDELIEQSVPEVDEFVVD